VTKTEEPEEMRECFLACIELVPELGEKFKDCYENTYKEGIFDPKQKG